MYFQVFGSRVKVDRVGQVAEIELAEKEKMKDKVGLIHPPPSAPPPLPPPTSSLRLT